MRKLIATMFVLSLALAAPAAANTHQARLHASLGSSCTHTAAGPFGYRAICSNGHVVRLAKHGSVVREWSGTYYVSHEKPGSGHKVNIKGRTIRTSKEVKVEHHGQLLLATDSLYLTQPELSIAAVPPARCDDNRGRLDPEVVNGLPFHTWFFRVNLGQSQIATWQSGGTYASGFPERVIFEMGAGFGDWMGMRNPSPGSAPQRYAPGSETGCALSWPQQQSPSSDPNQNPGRVNFSYQGDTLNSASLESTCHGGGGVFPDGVSVVSVRNYCDNNLIIAETTRAYNAQGYTVEADMTFNNRVNGPATTWCYRFTAGCSSLASLAANPSMIPMEDLARHEVGHVIVLGHTCGTLPCSHNTMDVDYATNEWPRDIGQGDRNNEYIFEVTH